MKLVYLAGPIDDVSPEEATLWRDKATRAFHGYGIAVYDPAGAFNVPNLGPVVDLGKTIREVNTAAIVHCDGLFANLTGPGRAFGTIREIERATRMGRVVVVAGDLYTLEAYDVITRANLDAAIETMAEELGRALVIEYGQEISD